MQYYILNLHQIIKLQLCIKKFLAKNKLRKGTPFMKIKLNHKYLK